MHIFTWTLWVTTTACMNLTFIVSNTIILPGNVLPSITVFGIFPPNLLFLVVKILVLSFCYRRLLAATRWGGSSRNWQCPNYHIRWLQEVCYRPCYIFQPAYWYQDGCIYWRSKADKKSVLMNWSADKITLFVSTSAFGLGVNKPDVRNVIHLRVPDSLESWMPKAGEAVEMETTVLVCFHICHCYVSIVPTHK